VETECGQRTGRGKEKAACDDKEFAFSGHADFLMSARRAKS
jgi:hypothetical protein